MGDQLLGNGIGRSKKEAEQQGASKALAKLNVNVQQ
jgi:ribonuclease-3